MFAIAVNFVNSFARRQHLFEISSKHRLTSIRIFRRILLPCPFSNFAQNVII